jgi:hypothetical protein
VIDGWGWRADGGRPSHYTATALLLRIEVWRDVRAQVRPTDGRVTRADALAEVLAYDLRRCDPVAYRRVDRRRRHYVEEGHSPTRALTRATKDLHGKHFRKLQSMFSQALSRYQPARLAPSTTSMSAFVRRARLVGLGS